MTEKIVKVENRAGVHARPSSMIVQLTKDFPCNVYFEMGTTRVNAKSIMGIITLLASYGSEIKIIADGEGEAAAVETLANLFKNKFEES
ncbi:MAG: HPr family phosphocarrier protein [Spirochaetes bacterium]|nr:HPr family phosphocarrier protein [Spirochaetota bacterium]